MGCIGAPYPFYRQAGVQNRAYQALLRSFLPTALAALVNSTSYMHTIICIDMTSAAFVPDNQKILIILIYYVYYLNKKFYDNLLIQIYKLPLLQYGFGGDAYQVTIKR